MKGRLPTPGLSSPWMILPGQGSSAYCGSRGLSPCRSAERSCWKESWGGGMAGRWEALGNDVLDDCLGELCLGFQLQRSKNVVGQSCPGFWGSGPSAGHSCMDGCGGELVELVSLPVASCRAWVNHHTLPWHSWGWSEQNPLRIWK